ncbi:MAG TPA: transglycosylase SLT domain-containing protein [Casimicrobiaceae bacterium]|nr:transglycosylase SLT domain-containing protein [Casimicrobiaceae bacterium]
MRIALITAVATFVLLAGCATAPVPPPVEPPPVAIAPVPEPEPLPALLANDSKPIARLTLPQPLSESALLDLEPLPMPAEDLWDRIGRGYRVPDIDGPLVEKWERWYADRPDYVARMVERSRRYLYHIVTEVDRRGMPLDVALLPMIESAFNPTALSSARAAGIWQFIPSTGRHYGLQQNFWFDSRRDVIAATERALDYLQKLHGDFGDWQLALAAYNWGEGNVRRALRQNETRKLPLEYVALAMPDETRNYLPKLQAVKNIVREPEKYGLVLADVPDAPYFSAVKVRRKMDVKRAAELAEMPEEQFLALNPQHNRPVMAGADEFTILLPTDKAELFAAKLDLHDQPLVSWQAYRMKENESLPTLAAKFGMSLETLRAINGIGSRSRVPAGHLLLVPAERPSKAADASLEKAVFTAVPQGRTFFHTVRRGETLFRIADQYKVTAAELREWNGLAQNAIAVGQQLRVTSDVVRGRSSRSAVATGGAKAAKRGSSAPAHKMRPAVATPDQAKHTAPRR